MQLFCFWRKRISQNLNRIGQNLQNEVPVKRSIHAEFSNYHLNSLNGKLNGSRQDNMHGSIQTKNDQSRH